MPTIIHAKGVKISSDARAFLERRFAFALRRFENEIERIEVFLKDLNGAAKGGQDQSVLIKVRLRGKRAVVVEAISHDAHAAVNLATKRCKRAVRRSLRQARRVDHTRLQQVTA